MRIPPLCYLPIALSLVFCSPKTQSPVPPTAGADWRYYLGDPFSSQYSSLEQITPENVAQLQVAWTYERNGADPNNRSQIQCNPLIISGILYGSSAKLNFFALDAETGEEIWVFRPLQW